MVRRTIAHMSKAPRLGCSILLLVAASAAVADQAPAALTLDSCSPVKNQPPLRCGKFSVPENWDKPTGRLIAINIVVLPATGSVTLPPLYDFPGGPGIAETGSADFWLTAGSIHRAHREIVLIDQRGTGASHPLTCALPFSDPSQEMFPPDAVRHCRRELSKDADLAQYSTDAAVRDVEAVRAALHHDRIDVSGLSYGTRFAQAYALAHPDRVRAMALIGTVPPDMQLPEEFAADAQRVMDRLLDECAAAAECKSGFPNLRAEWVLLRERLRETPAVLGGHTVIPGAFWEAFRGQLGATEAQRHVPLLVHTLAGNDPDAALAQLHAEDPPFFASGLLLSVECPEDTLFLSPAARQRNGQGTFLGNYRVQRQYAACKEWSLPPKKSTYRQVKTLSMPTLFVVGELDDVTPPDATARARRNFPNSRVIQIPDLGHFPSGLDHMECMDQIIAEFFDRGITQGLETGCLHEMHAPPFDTAQQGSR
jgi:pimeloyl-ACP methyl ester carboxylesterase